MILIKVQKQFANPTVLEQISLHLKESNVDQVGSYFDSDDNSYCILCNTTDKNINTIFHVLEESLPTELTKQVKMDYIEQKNEEDSAVEKEILDALQDDRVVIYLQPIYSNKAKRFVSGEVLTRIVRPDGSLIPPGVFIPVAERSKLINLLERRILEKTIEFLAENDIHEIGLDFIEMNISIKTGERDDFVDICKSVLKKHNVNPKSLNVEITETANITEKSNLLANMKRLIDEGFQFSLDDFGSGYSNLNYVIDMPVSVLKFDLDMTKATEKDNKAYIVMKHAVYMAHELELCTVAEGVETEESLQRMVDMGVDYIQGYYFSKPLPVNEFISFIKEHNNKEKYEQQG